MAATLTQSIANRLNALKSSGPRTEAGKSRSSLNAIKHGLSRLPALPAGGMASAIADRKEQWRSAYGPEGSAQEWLFDRLCAESVRLDFCEARIRSLLAEHAQQAAESWDDIRAAAVAEQAARLSARPEVIQPQLLQSKHGVLWLLERWDEVADSLRRCQGWAPATWELAMDLLGLSANARAGSGPWDLDPEDPTEAPGLDLVRRSVEALRDRLSSHLDDRDARARLDAEAGLGLDEPADVRLLERYARDARRQFSRWLAELRRLQGESTPKASPAVPGAADSCSTAPPPRPSRSPSAASSSPTPGLADASSNLPESYPARSISSPAPASGSLSSMLRDRLAPAPPPSNRRTRRALSASRR